MLPICCCPTCTIFSDDFATDRTGTDYTTVSGSFTVSGGVITTGSAGALIVENTAGTTGHGHVTIKGKVDTSNGKFRLVGSYQNSSNYLFAEIVVNGASSTFKLWKRVAGVDTQLGSTFTFTGSTGTYYTLQVCWDGTNAVAACPEINHGITAAYAVTNNQAGFGASPNGGTATFDDFTFSKHHSDDPACDECTSVDDTSCSICESSEFPQFLKLVITGVTNDACTNCGVLNGTWIIDGGGSSPPVCSHTYTDYCNRASNDTAVTPCSNIDPAANGTRFNVIWFRNGNDYYVQVLMETPTHSDPAYTGPFLDMAWIASIGTFASPPNCFDELDGVTLAFDCRFNTSGTEKCTGTGSTATLTVL